MNNAKILRPEHFYGEDRVPSYHQCIGCAFHDDRTDACSQDPNTRVLLQEVKADLGPCIQDLEPGEGWGQIFLLFDAGQDLEDNGEPEPYDFDDWPEHQVPTYPSGF